MCDEGVRGRLEQKQRCKESEFEGGKFEVYTSRKRAMRGVIWRRELLDLLEF